MSVRVVLAVVAALALVAAAQPAVDHATRSRDAAALRATTDRVADAVAALHRRSEPGSTFATAPRRTVDVALPAGATLRVRSNPPRLVASLGAGPGHRRTLDVPVAVCGDRSTLRGTTTLAFVETTDGPVVVATRGFIPGDGTKPSHACTAR
ncbi:MAG: hypothetical protein ABEJ88_05100 [Halobacterium sp.]